MNKRDLVRVLVETTDLSQADASVAVEAIFSAIAATLARGDEVRLTGFGTFSVAKRKASIGRNPRTGEAMSIKASTSPKFRAAKSLRNVVGDDGWGGTRQK